MGKKQHQKDKMYLTSTEWSTLYGGKKAAQKFTSDPRAQFRRLPFYCCSLSLQPFEHPYCSEDGFIFDLTQIVPYLKKYSHHPVTGKQFEAKQLVKLNFHKNADGKYHCPATYKVFNENSHIVAIRPTGNVFSYEGVERLNLKCKNFKDLLTDEPFKRSDIIHLQDPTNVDKFNMSSFHHLKNNLKIDEDEDGVSSKDPNFTIRNVNPEMKHALEEMEKEFKANEKAKETKEAEKATSRNAAHYSTGQVAQSLTSTVAAPQTVNEAAIIDKDTLRYQTVKKKGYVRLCTNHGDLNIELHCDLVPKTCENFVILAKRGYYNDTVFHRSIRNFMIQGGDPTGTGKGGESAWGDSFKDEFKSNLTHQGRGILSMANSGADTNKSQFFITYRSCRHLDNKHSVFGKVVGGLDVLNTIEKVTTDKTDRPKEDIKINKVIVFVDPFEEADELMGEDVDQTSEQKATKEEKTMLQAKEEDVKPKVFRSGVGKYIPVKEAEGIDPSLSGTKRSVQNETSSSSAPKKSKLKLGSRAFGNFDSW